VGNSLSRVRDKDVFIIGEHVLHLFQCSSFYQSEQSHGVLAVLLFFDKFSFGKQFFEIAEMKQIQDLLFDANQVIKVDGPAKDAIFDLIMSTRFIQNEELIIVFLKILSLIRQADKTYINNEQYNLILNNNEGDRMNDVLNYSLNNYQEEITIDQISKVAFLSRSQFSYFFKLHTGKTYIQFLNELRIENACILLKSNHLSIDQICYEVGFKNVSNYTRHFKKTKNVTPSQFRKSWILP